ncbi:hypothetical protein PR048_020518 [Dryococelus australis]|uniref:BED-type domain-containing protein n=1 Tax=Dryococelus australis TaxID=614101 RepID=A0ABQ9H6K0_9NEOP|nr:hypothetical protein PR048_020518 [Dryococelus australis]
MRKKRKQISGIDRASEKTQELIKVESRRVQLFGRRVKMSSVWKYFSKDLTDVSKAKCNQCGKIVSRGGKVKSRFTTSNLIKHLARCGAHQNMLKAVSLESRIKIENNSFDATSCSLSKDAFNMNSKYDKNDRRAKEINRAIGEMLCLNKLPYSFVETEGFRVLMSKTCPEYEIPCGKFFANTLIPDMYEEAEAKVSEILNSAEEMCITLDLWTSVGNSDYISITAHFHDRNFEKHYVFLEMMPCDTHSSQLIFENLKAAFAKWNISTKVKAVVTNSTANMAEAVAKLDVLHVGCSAHLIQLVSLIIVVDQAILNHPNVRKLLRIANQLVGFFKHSTAGMKALNEAQLSLGQKQKCLLQDEPTRSDSTFTMLQRLVEQKNVIAVVANQFQQVTNLQASEWVLADNVLVILSHFTEFAKEISKRDTSLADVWALIHSLKAVLTNLQEKLEEQNVSGFLNDVHSELVRRFPLVDSKANILATVLDPRYKTSLFDDEASILIKCRELISEEISLIVPAADSKNNWSSLDADADECEHVTETRQLTLMQVTKRLLSQKTKNKRFAVGETSIELELDDYLSTSPVGYDTSPADFWKTSLHRNIKRLSKFWLSVPAGSIFSEQDYSQGGLATDHCSLLPHHVNQLVFLKENLRYLK